MASDQSAPVDLTTMFSQDYIDDDLGPMGSSVPVVFFALSFVFMALRIWARLKSHGRLKLDDYVLLFSAVLQVPLLTITLLAIKRGGFGRHLPVLMAINPLTIEYGLLMLFIIEIFYSLSLAVTKISILIMYYSVFPTRFMKRGVILLGITVLMWVVAVWLVTIFQCRPVDFAWAKSRYPDGYCINNNDFFIGNAVPNICTDVFMLMLPTYEVYRLHMQRGQKIAVASIFMIGALVVVCSGIRLKTLFDLSADPDRDTSYSILMAWMFNVIEASTAIISACLPTLKPLFRLLFGESFAPSSHGQTGLPTIQTYGGGNSKQKSSKKSKASSRGASNVLTTTQALGSFERLQDTVSPSLTPKEYSNLRTTTIVKRDSNSDTTDDIPLEGIHVKRDVTWEESVLEKKF